MANDPPILPLASTPDRANPNLAILRDGKQWIGRGFLFREQPVTWAEGKGKD
jgi:hypothetical protein